MDAAVGVGHVMGRSEDHSCGTARRFSAFLKAQQGMQSRNERVVYLNVGHPEGGQQHCNSQA